MPRTMESYHTVHTLLKNTITEMSPYIVSNIQEGLCLYQHTYNLNMTFIGSKMKSSISFLFGGQ